MATLLAEYPFDEGTGTSYTDSSGNGNHFTTLNSGGWTADEGPPLGRAAFCTNGALAPTGAPFGQTAARTVMAWFAANSAPSAEWAVEWHLTSADTGAWGLLFLGNVRLRGRNASTFAEASAPFPTPGGAWHHYAGTYDGSNLRLYIDGTLAATTAFAGPLRTDADVFQILSGSQSTDALNVLRVFDGALTADEVAAWMATPPGEEPPGETTPIGQDGGAAWRVRGLAAGDAATAWRHRAATGRDGATAWETRTIAGRTAETAWRIRSLTGRDASTAWRTRALVGRDSVTAWRTRALAGQAAAAGWRARGLIGRAAAAAWRVLGDEPDHPASTYSVDTRVIGRYSCTARTVGYTSTTAAVTDP